MKKTTVTLKADPTPLVFTKVEAAQIDPNIRVLIVAQSNGDKSFFPMENVLSWKLEDGYLAN